MNIFKLQKKWELEMAEISKKIMNLHPQIDEAEYDEVWWKRKQLKKCLKELKKVAKEIHQKVINPKTSKHRTLLTDFNNLLAKHQNTLPPEIKLKWNELFREL